VHVKGESGNLKVYRIIINISERDVPNDFT